MALVSDASEVEPVLDQSYQIELKENVQQSDRTVRLIMKRFKKKVAQD